MMDPADHLPDIGVLEDAFRKAAKRCHPDLGGSDEKFIRLVRACNTVREVVAK